MAASLPSRRPLPIGSRPVDLVLAVFMLINIPIVLLVESQAVFPSVFFPQSLLDAVQWYVHLSGDYLVRDKPPFFRGLVLAELVFQLPLLVVNSYAFIAGKGWGRITGILFGAQLFTTMVPIFADLLATNVPTRNLLLGIYLPYIIMPVIILARLIPSEHPFSEPADSLNGKKGD
jgi:hypothetical protein